jgi:predicted N-acyltransferase
MVGILVLLIILFIIGVVANLAGLIDGGLTFLRRYILFQGFKKQYTEPLEEMGISFKPHNHYNWVKTEFEDYRMELKFINKKERKSIRFKINVDSQGKLVSESEHKELLEIMKNKM